MFTKAEKGMYLSLPVPHVIPRPHCAVQLHPAAFRPHVRSSLRCNPCILFRDNICKQGRCHDTMQKCHESVLPIRGVCLLVVSPQSPPEHWRSPMAARFCETLYRQDRVSDGAFFSAASSFLMLRMRSTFALAVRSSLDSSLTLRYSA